MAQNDNPFAEAWKSLDAWKNFSGKNSPVDFNEIFSNGQKNFESVATAQKALAEGFQAIAKRQVEIVQQNTEAALKLFKEVASSKDPKESASKQAEFAKSAFEKAASDARETAEIAAKYSNKVLEIFGKQASENFKKMSEATKTSEKKAA